jgi:hypothetical protein
MAEKSGLGQASSVNKSLDASRCGNRDRPDRASLPASLGTTTMDARTHGTRGSQLKSAPQEAEGELNWNALRRGVWSMFV